MTITLRISGGPNHGEPVGAGVVARYSPIDQEPRPGFRAGTPWVVDNWSQSGDVRVYARLADEPAMFDTLIGFRPSELGLYIGHERGQPVSSIKWGGPPEPSVKAAWIADAYTKARQRAKDSPDPLLSRAMAAGVDDFMLQLMKLVGSGSPAIEELLAALTKAKGV